MFESRLSELPQGMLFLKEPFNVRCFDLGLSSMILRKLCSHSQFFAVFVVVNFQDEASEYLVSIAPINIAVQPRQCSQGVHTCALHGFGCFDLVPCFRF